MAVRESDSDILGLIRYRSDENGETWYRYRGLGPRFEALDDFRSERAIEFKLDWPWGYFRLQPVDEIVLAERFEIEDE